MTAPPGGPYGQDPYRTNPYGQDPYRGDQPQGGPYQYPQGGPYQYPQGGPYSYPPGGPSPAGAYPPQQYPQPGQQVPPGWPAAPYPPQGPPPGGPRSKLPWLILAGIAVLGVIALVGFFVFWPDNSNNSSSSSNSTAASPPGPSASPSSPTTPTSEPDNSQQTATECTSNVSPGELPAGGSPISAGKLSFPTTAAPGWTPFTDDKNPNLIGAVGLSKDAPGANQWEMLAELATTNFVTSMDIAAQASKLMQCVAAGPGYSSASPTLGPTKTSSITVDGVKAARADADVTIADTSIGVKGDSITIIAVDTKPVTIFMGATPIGDTASAATINQVIAALKVAK